MQSTKFESLMGTRTFCGIVTEGMQEYLCAIYLLSEVDDKVTTKALADKMYVSAPAASSMLKRLEESAFVERSSSDGIQLTEQGRLSALQLLRTLRLLEVFLVEVMGYTWDQVDVEAERLAHAISPAFEERIALMCGEPTHCPHGEPIPTVEGKVLHEQLVLVHEMKPGQHGIVRSVSGRDASVLRYLSRLNLVPGQKIRLVEIAPFNGPVTLEVISENGSEHTTTQVVGNELSEQIRILPE